MGCCTRDAAPAALLVAWRAGPGHVGLASEMAVALAADRVYESVDELTAAFHDGPAVDSDVYACLLDVATGQTSLQAALVGLSSHASGTMAHRSSSRHQSDVLLLCPAGWGAWPRHSDLLPSDQPGPTQVTTAATGGTRSSWLLCQFIFVWATRVASLCRYPRWTWTWATT